MCGGDLGNVVIHGPECFREVPWQNGRGKTLVLLSEPCGAVGQFAWRLSIAGVDSDGSFSHFENCHRVLLLLEGHGLTLTHSNGQVDKLTARFAQALFPGDIETVAYLPDGPVRDFNVVWHRDRCTAAVHVLGIGATELVVDGDLLLAYAVDTAVTAASPPGPAVRIDARHLMRYAAPVPGSWSFTGGPVIVILLWRK